MLQFLSNEHRVDWHRDQSRVEAPEIQLGKLCRVMQQDSDSISPSEASSPQIGTDTDCGLV